MQVLFDAQIFAAQQHGGISRYIASLAHHMSALPGTQARIVAPLHINDHLDRLPRALFHGGSRRVSARAKPCARAVGWLASGLAALRLRPDILHRTYYYPQIHPASGVRSVITVYDMIHERHPQGYSALDPIARWKVSAVRRADHIICISENTRRDLLATYDLPEAGVSVTHLGYDELGEHAKSGSAPGSGSPAGTGNRPPYLLYVGSRSSYKNFSGLVTAFGTSPWMRNNFRLRCFGGGPVTAAEAAMIERCGVTGRVDFTSGSDDALADAYRGAALFVYPSLYEGFGIPPLEAMSLDCPVACSNTSSIPEVVGDAAATFDPADPDAVRTTLESVLESDELRASLVERGRHRRRLFSWQRCAAETVDIYRKVLAL